MLPLTFGIEIEFIFAAKSEDPTVTLDEKDPKPWTLQQVVAFYENWGMFPLLYQIFRHSNLDLLEPYIDANGYSLWQLVNDGSVNADGTGLYTALSDRIKSETDTFPWTTTPMELVSRVLAAPDSSNHPSLKELRAYVSTLRGPSAPDTPYGAFISPSCGLHVHIGTSTGPLPFPVLRHLAYLTTIYEDLISLLHPLTCRYTRWALSNQGSFRRSNHICPSRASLSSPREVYERIFAPDLTPVGLGVLMSGYSPGSTGGERGREILAKNIDEPLKVNKYHIINWKSIALGVAEKPTIEFRQHAGSLDSEEISMWVRFLTQLVRTAERFADIEVNSSHDEGESPASSSPTDPTTADDSEVPLIDLLTSLSLSPSRSPIPAHFPSTFPSLSTPSRTLSAFTTLSSLLSLPPHEHKYFLARLRTNLTTDEFIPLSSLEFCDACAQRRITRQRCRQRRNLHLSPNTPSGGGWTNDQYGDDELTRRQVKVMMKVPKSRSKKKGAEGKKQRKEAERKARVKVRRWRKEVEEKKAKEREERASENERWGEEMRAGAWERRAEGYTQAQAQADAVVW